MNIEFLSKILGYFIEKIVCCFQEIDSAMEFVLNGSEPVSVGIIAGLSCILVCCGV